VAEVAADMNTAITAPAVDATPPTAPGSINAAAVSDRQINVSWAAATDNTGVTGYLLERCQGAGCTGFSQIAAPAGTTYSDGGLAAGTSYSYRVRAVDAADNRGPYSPIASAMTQAGAVLPTVSTLSCTPPTLSGAGSVSCTVTITPAAGTGGFTVTLSSDNRNLTIPGSLTIAAGASSGSFAATAAAVSTAQTAQVTAAGGGVSRSFAVSLVPAGWSISGTVGAAGGGAAVNLSGAVTATVIADAQGSYSFGGLGAGTYTVTPVKSGLAFTPSSRTVTLSSGSAVGVNFGTETPAGSLITVDARAWREQRQASTTIASPAFSTTSGSQLLLALVAMGPSRTSDPRTRRLSGGGLSWSRLSRASGSSGAVEIWSAWAAQPLTNVSVSATLSVSVLSTLTVLSFKGTDPADPIGVVRAKSASRGPASDTLLATRGGSLVVALGNDPGTATSRTLIAGQSMVHEALIGTNTFWSQAALGPAAGASLTVGVTAPTATPYNFTLCELLAAPPASPPSAEPTASAAAPEARPAAMDGIRLGSAATGRAEASCSPGAVATLLGAGLSGESAHAAGDPLPTELAGRAVLVNGERAPLLLAAPEQINFLCPDLAPGTPLRIEVAGVAGAVLETVMATASPSVFEAADGRGVIAIAGTELLAGPADGTGATRPARRGESLVLYATGLGRRAAATVRVVVDGWEVEPSFTGPAGGHAGVHEVRFHLPEGAPLGAVVPVYLKVTFEEAGSSRAALSNAVKLPVEAERE
jgi:uncharacterized protein (TIGR03437 family)